MPVMKFSPPSSPYLSTIFHIFFLLKERSGELFIQENKTSEYQEYLLQICWNTACGMSDIRIIVYCVLFIPNHHICIIWSS